MTPLLDTNIIIDFLRKYPPAIAYISQQREFEISAVTLTELNAGAYSTTQRAYVQALRQRLTVYEINSDIALTAGEYLRSYSRSHHLDTTDALIAATAEHHALTLVTRNKKHYPMLKKVLVPY